MRLVAYIFLPIILIIVYIDPNKYYKRYIMKIVTLGNCCKNAKDNHKNACIAAKNCGVDEPENIGDLREMIKLGILATPSLLIDGEAVAIGKMLSVAEIEKLIKARL